MQGQATARYRIHGIATMTRPRGGLLQQAVAVPLLTLAAASVPGAGTVNRQHSCGPACTKFFATQQPRYYALAVETVCDVVYRCHCNEHCQMRIQHQHCDKCTFRRRLCRGRYGNLLIGQAACSFEVKDTSATLRRPFPPYAVPRLLPYALPLGPLTKPLVCTALPLY